MDQVNLWLIFLLDLYAYAYVMILCEFVSLLNAHTGYLYQMFA